MLRTASSIRVEARWTQPVTVYVGTDLPSSESHGSTSWSIAVLPCVEVLWGSISCSASVECQHSCFLCGELRVQISIRILKYELKFFVGFRSTFMQIFEHYLDLGHNFNLRHNIDLGHNFDLGLNIDFRHKLNFGQNLNLRHNIDFRHNRFHPLPF